MSKILWGIAKVGLITILANELNNEARATGKEVKNEVKQKRNLAMNKLLD